MMAELLAAYLVEMTAVAKAAKLVVHSVDQLVARTVVLLVDR